jgi:hypothetical protein
MSPFAARSCSGGTSCGVSPEAAGRKTPVAAPWTKQRHELPDLGMAGHEQQPEQPLAEEPDDVRGDHDVLSGEPVGPHAARQEEEHLPEDPREEDEPEV